MRMGFQAGVKYKNKIFFSEESGFGLFSYDLSTHKVDFCLMFDEIFCFALHSKAFLCGNEAWFLPQTGKDILCVNLDTLIYKRYKVEFRKVVKKPWVLLEDAVVIDNYLVCTPYDIDTLVIIDMKSHTIRCIADFIDPETESIMSVGKQNGKAVFYPDSGDYIRIVDPVTGQWIKTKREDKQYEFGDVAILEEGYLFSPGVNNLIVMEGKKKFKASCTGDKYFYYGNERHNSEILFFPFACSNFLIINISDNSYRCIPIYGEARSSTPHSLKKIDSEKGLYIASSLTRHILTFDFNTDEVKIFPIEADQKELHDQIILKTSDIQKRKIIEYRNSSINYENYKESLECLIEYISDRK